MVTTSEDIDNVLLTHVGPMIATHGGAIELLNYDAETGNVHVKLSGSCAGCSASVFTLKVGVENTLMNFFPGDVTSVTHEEGEVVHPYYQFSGEQEGNMEFSQRLRNAARTLGGEKDEK